jgi:hypothetical protein
VWDMRDGVLRGPAHRRAWLVGLRPDAAIPAEQGAHRRQNRHYPDRGESRPSITPRAVRLGKLQHRPGDAMPYAIMRAELARADEPWGFGSDARACGGRRLPHIVMLYFHYADRHQYPEIGAYLDAAGYLERATRTARLLRYPCAAARYGSASGAATTNS